MRASDLTKDEQANTRAALRFLKARLGGWAPLARALRFGTGSLANFAGRTAPSTKLVFRIARLAGVSVDDVLEGRFPPPGTCPHCGHRPSDFIDEDMTP